MKDGRALLKKLKKKKERLDNMERTLSLLNEKNHYLEKFYSLGEDSLPEFRQGVFDKLERFYATREQILDVIKYIDSQLQNESQIQTDLGFMNMDHKQEFKRSLAIKDEYVNRIIHQDMEILSCIESAKNTIIRELQEIRKAKKAVSGYKVPTFTNRLDEEA